MPARPSARRDTARLVVIAARVAPGLFGGAVIVTLVAGATAPTFFVASGWLVRDAAAGSAVLGPVATLAAVFLAGQVIPPVGEQLSHALRGRVASHLMVRLVCALATPSALERLEDPDALDRLMLAKGIGPGSITPGHALPGIFLRARKWFQTAAAAVIVARFSVPLATIVLVVIVAERFVIGRAYRAFGQATMGSRSEHRRRSYLRRLGFEGPPAREAKLFGATNWLTGEFRTAAYATLAELWRKRRRVAAFQAVPIGIDVVMNGAALAYIVHAGITGRLAIDQVVVVSQAMFGIGAILFNHGDELQIAQGVASLRPMLDLDGELRVDQSTGPPPSPSAHSIRFERVSFRYPNQPDHVLTDLTLELRAATSTAIVGANGAGKTTLVKLLAGLLRPTAGSITVDGVSLGDLDRAGWQRHVAAVFQDFARVRFSPREAIGFGAPDHISDRAGLDAVADAVGARDFIERLPGGWDTPLDRTWDGGVDLSGGQWQRLALARALFAARHGAGILILDEPAAQLDARGEADLHDRFLDITRGLTTVVVSHRFSTVRRADRIIVLASGAVVEDGTHYDLMRRDGIYATYFRLQADAFAEDPR